MKKKSSKKNWFQTFIGESRKSLENKLSKSSNSEKTLDTPDENSF